eukprot:gene7972-12241_t
MADVVYQKIKAVGSLVPSQDWVKVRTALESSAGALWSNGKASIGAAKGGDVALRVLCLLASCGHADEKTSGTAHTADQSQIVAAAAQLIASPRCNKKVRVLCTHLICLWASEVPRPVLDSDFVNKDALSAVEACAEVLLATASEEVVRERAMALSVWVTSSIDKKGNAFASVQHLAWPALLQLVHAQEEPTRELALAIEKVQQFVGKQLLPSTEHKKGTAIDPDGKKLIPSDQWTVLNVPNSASTGFTDLQECHAWSFAALPVLVSSSTAEPVFDYALRILMQVSNAINKGVLSVASSFGSGAGIGFIEVVLIHLMEVLSAAIAAQPSLVAGIEGELLGLFFQLLPMSLQRGESVSRAALMQHVPYDLLLESLGDTIGASEEAQGVPFVKGEVFLAMLGFFAAAGSETESAAVEAFFGSPHWLHWAHAACFAPSVFGYVKRNAHRPALATVKQSLHLKLLRLAGLSPHSSIPSLLRVVPVLVNRVTYLDLLHRILDLPLYAHAAGRPSLATDASNVKAVFPQKFTAALLGALFSSRAFESAEESDYVAFWAAHRHDVEAWVAEVEPTVMSRKAAAATKGVVQLLKRYFGCVSFEAGRDPIMTVNIVTAMLGRYHMLFLPRDVAREVRSLLLQEVYRLVANTPQVLELITDEMITCVRQFHIGKRSHRCVHLTGTCAAILSQGILKVVKPPTEPNPTVSVTVQNICAELHRSLFDVLAMLYRRTDGLDCDMYTTKVTLFRLSDGRAPRSSSSKSKRSAGKKLHDTLEAEYTVWDAVDCVNSLAVAIATIGVLVPRFLETARAACAAIARATAGGVLPPMMHGPIEQLRAWLSRPATTMASILKPCPPMGIAPLCTDSTTALTGFLPRPAHQRFLG